MIYFEELKLDYLEIAVLSQNYIWNWVIGVIMQTFLVRYFYIDLHNVRKLRHTYSNISL